MNSINKIETTYTKIGTWGIYLVQKYVFEGCQKLAPFRRTLVTPIVWHPIVSCYIDFDTPIGDALYNY